jgi:hypothetical protein
MIFRAALLAAAMIVVAAEILNAQRAELVLR